MIRRPLPKSTLLARQLRQAFGDHSPDDPKVDMLIQMVDATYQRVMGNQKTAGRFGRVSVSEWNLQSGLIESGHEWKAQLGYAPDALDCRLATWRGLAEPNDLIQLIEQINQHSSGAAAFFERDVRFRSASAEWRWQRIGGMISERAENGRPLKMTVAIADVDEARRSQAEAARVREAAESASRTRSAFLANMSHEVRTPMNAVIGMADLLQGTPLDEEQKHYLNIIRSSADALLTVINDILDFSKIEAGKLQFERLDFSLRALVFESVRALALTAQKKGLEVLVKVAPDVPPRLLGDPTRLRQVITNLVSNAIKFTDQGEIAVDVSMDGCSADSVALCFCVRDTGMGIPADKQQAIFEAFAQADLTITRRFGGTGLGLAICSRLVEMMGGKIWVESAPSEGSRFYFTCHFGIAAAAQVAAPPRFAGKRCLIAVVNRELAQLLRAVLERFGFQPQVENDAGCAVQLILGSPRFDLLLADAQMLDESDAALVTAWQAHCGLGQIIALHTLAERQVLSPRLRSLGVECHVIKPISDDELVDAIGITLGGDGAGEFNLEEFTVDESLAMQRLPGSHLDILLVEDNLINQELATRLLQKSGHRVTVANNGQEALELFDHNHYDIILMDMQMPVMGGIEATEAIRAREMRRSWVLSMNQAATAYIIAMTANAMSGDRERCLDAGMNDYLSKPIQRDALDAALARACRELGKPTAGEVPSPDAEGKPERGIDLDATERDLGDRSLVLDLAGKMLEQWDRWLEMLDTALLGRDAESLLRDSHTVKGLLAMFHADNAKTMALDLERSARAKEWIQAEMHLADLKAEMGRIKPLLVNAVKRV